MVMRKMFSKKIEGKNIYKDTSKKNTNQMVSKKLVRMTNVKRKLLLSTHSRTFISALIVERIMKHIMGTAKML